MGGHKKHKEKDKEKDKKKSKHRDNKASVGTSGSKLAGKKERHPSLHHHHQQHSRKLAVQKEKESKGVVVGGSATKIVKVNERPQIQEVPKAPSPQVNVDEDAPTMMIAPDDYVHMYAAKAPVVVGASSSKNQGGKGESVEQKAKVERIPSDAPTAMIAPEDYENLYTASKQKGPLPPPPPPVPLEILAQLKVPMKEDTLQKVPSDAPTALIAPDDYCHIFAQPPKNADEKKGS